MRRTASLLILAAIIPSTMLWAQDARTRAEALRTPIVKAVEIATPAVVNVWTTKVITSAPHPNLRKVFEQSDEYFERFKQKYERSGKSLGSGVIVDKRGYVLTNDHVVQRASKINIRLKDKRTFQARLISADPMRDLAVIKIIGEGPFPTANIYRTTPLMIGETAIAIGNPFGFEHTVTTGVVSASGRELKLPTGVIIKNLIQTDASINPGNSGGALIDLNGDLIGINTAIKSEAEGIGFAIPVTEIQGALVNMLDYRRLKKIWVGMGLRPGFDRRTMEPAGLQVTTVQEASPAHKAGLQSGDVIVKLNGERCVEILQFELDILERSPGDVITVEGFRDRKPFKAELTLARLPMANPVTIIRKKLGLVVRSLTDDEAKRMDLEDEKGLLIEEVEPKGPAGIVGLKKGDVISLFATYRIEDVEALSSVLQKLRVGERQIIVLYRGGKKFWTSIVPR